MKEYFTRFLEFIEKKTENHKTVWLFLLFMPYVYHICIPSGDIVILNFIFNRLSILNLFFLLLINFVIKKRKPSKLFTLLLIEEIYLFIITFINNRVNTNKTALFVVSSLGIALIVETYIDDYKTLIKSLMLNFELQIYPNLITVLLFNDVDTTKIMSYNGNHFFLGTKNDLILYLLPAFCLCIIYLLKIKINIRPIALITAILATFVFSFSTTTLFSFMTFCGVFILLYFIFKNKYKSIYPIVILIIAFCCVIVLPYLISGENIIVDYIMNNVFYKHSFISRTSIWADANKYCNSNIVFGYGFNNKNLVYVDDIGRIYEGNAHSDIVQRIMNVGIVGTGLFIVFNAELLRKVNSYENSLIKTIMVSFICSIYITFIAQDYHRFFEFQLVFFIAYNLLFIEKPNTD